MNIYLNFDYVLKKNELAKFKQYILKRTKHIPIQYILREAHFRSLKLYVDENVMIPRPETEILVDELLSAITYYIDRLKKGGLKNGCINILEIGTGSGAIAISLAREVKIKEGIDFNIIATEKNNAALQVAKKNAEYLLDADRLSKIEFVSADIVPDIEDTNFGSKYRSSINIIVSNPPYVSSQGYEKLPREIRDYEPAGAIYAGKSGLEVYEKILGSVFPYLDKKLAILLFETDPVTASPLKKLIENSFGDDQFVIRDITIKKDYNKLERVLKAAITKKTE